MFANKKPKMLDLSSPVIRWAQQRADKQGESFFLMKNHMGGIDIMPSDHKRLTPEGDLQLPIAIVHPFKSPEFEVGEYRHATV